MTDSIEQALELADEREHEIEGSDARYDDFHRPVAKLLYEQIVNDNKPEHWRARLEREHPEFKLPYVIPPTIADGDEEGAP